MTKRPQGRPRLDDDDTSTRVSVRVSSRDYDQLCRDAQADRVSLSEFIRQKSCRQSDRSD